MRITAPAGLPVHWNSETIEYSSMHCIMDPLLIFYGQEHPKSRVRETSGMTSGTPISEKSDIMISYIGICPNRVDGGAWRRRPAPRAAEAKSEPPRLCASASVSEASDLTDPTQPALSGPGRPEGGGRPDLPVTGAVKSAPLRLRLCLGR